MFAYSAEEVDTPLVEESLPKDESTEKISSTDEVMGEENTFWQTWFEFVHDVPGYFPVAMEKIKEPDPLESLNRKVFAFNDVADRYVLKPVAKSYQWVTPDPVEKGVSNVFSNLLEVTTIANDLLQLKGIKAIEDTGRFFINSTIGVLGIFDVASHMGLLKNDEDFGQTLGYWGVGSGPYVVVPLLGSYTFRSGLGAFADVNTDLLDYVDHIPTRNQAWALRVVDTRKNLFAAEKLITGDRYTFIRDAYLQQRESLVVDGAIQKDSFGEEDFDSWDDEDFDGWDDEE
jgi:phospholipid-binding lipoprotein MlaA